MDKLTGLLKSRKFWAALTGLALVVVRAYAPDFPLDDQAVSNVVWLLAAYILGVALDAGYVAAGSAAPRPASLPAAPDTQDNWYG